MVIVASVALSIMVSNDIVMPVLLRRKLMRRSVHRADFTKTLLRVRRTSIIVVLMLGYAYYRGADSQSGLASIGLLSFAAVRSEGRRVGKECVSTFKSRWSPE